ncbi:MAG: chromosomal replication initiator protein DnaA, partial [Chlamydia suis]|nr:chromosomal replication initiator protein DnaA [Chlamydia suis]
MLIDRNATFAVFSKRRTHYQILNSSSDKENAMLTCNDCSTWEQFINYIKTR